MPSDRRLVAWCSVLSSDLSAGAVSAILLKMKTKAPIDVVL